MKTKQSTKQPKEPTAEQLVSGLIISVGEARKILGADAKGLGDNQIAYMVLELEDLAHELLKYKHFAQ